jgi:hypothetical protein
MLLHTQGLDGLLHLYNRLETGGRVLLLCLLSAEAGVGNFGNRLAAARARVLRV